MKKNLLLRLCLILMVYFTAYSCRQDLLPEKETYNNSGAFQLTSKIISLNESKHRAKLLPELEKAEAEFKKLKTDALGKTVSYGNGGSIDTDNVTYIENGPNYHTYTFTVTRENATADAPLENLVLSPLTDGTYRELLFTYNLSATEKENIANGIPVDTQGKVSVTELTKGTYNTGGQLGKTSCNWVQTTIWIPCSSDDQHDGSNYWECEFVTSPSTANGTPPRVIVIEEYKCLLESDPGPGDGPGGSGTGGDGVGGGEGGTDPDDDPCNGNGVLTNPQQPGITDPNGCTGIPTMPTLPLLNTPCKKLKDVTNNTNGLKNKIKNLNTNDNLELDYEKGATVSEDAQGSTTLTSQDGNPGNTFITVNVPTTGEVIVYVHTHFEGSDMLPVFSIDDLVTFDAMHFQRRANNKSLSKLTMMVISKAGVFAMVIENSDLFYTMGGKLLTNEKEDLSDEYYGDLTDKINVTYSDVIKQVTKSLPDYGISLYKANADLSNWSKMSYNPATDIVDEIPCN